MNKQQVCAKDNILVHRFEEEAVLLNLNNEVYYSLNMTGYKMWQIVTTADSIDAALVILQEVYKIDEATIKTDLDAFIQELLHMDLVELKPVG